MTHPAFTPGSVAVITGGASGIGLATATEFARMGLRVVIADRAADRLAAAAQSLRAAGAADILTAELDVSDRVQLVALEQRVSERFGARTF